MPKSGKEVGDTGDLNHYVFSIAIHKKFLKTPKNKNNALEREMKGDTDRPN